MCSDTWEKLANTICERQRREWRGEVESRLLVRADRSEQPRRSLVYWKRKRKKELPNIAFSHRQGQHAETHTGSIHLSENREEKATSRKAKLLGGRAGLRDGLNVRHAKSKTRRGEL